MLDISRELDSSVALYSRKVLILTKATDVLPKWLRFLKGIQLQPRVLWVRGGTSRLFSPSVPAADLLSPPGPLSLQGW